MLVSATRQSELALSVYTCPLPLFFFSHWNTWFIIHTEDSSQSITVLPIPSLLKLPPTSPCNRSYPSRLSQSTGVSSVFSWTALLRYNRHRVNWTCLKCKSRWTLTSLYICWTIITINTVDISGTCKFLLCNSPPLAPSSPKAITDLLSVTIDSFAFSRFI